MDLLLAVLLIAGLSIATIVISLFGPTRWLIASFAWCLPRASSSTACCCSRSQAASDRRIAAISPMPAMSAAALGLIHHGATRCCRHQAPCLRQPLGQHRRRHRPAGGRAGVPAERDRRVPERLHLAAVADRRPLAPDRAEAARQPRRGARPLARRASTSSTAGCGWSAGRSRSRCSRRC